MSKKILVTFLLMAMAVFSLAGYACAADIFDSADSPSYNLRLGHVQTADHSYHLGAQYFADLVKERSKGKITVDVFPSSQLGNERDLTEGVQMGVIDAAVVGVAVIANFDPSFEVYNLPFLFRDRDHAYKVLGGDFGKAKFANLEQFDIVGLGYFENGFFDLLSSRSVKTPKDAAGLNVRTMENAVYMGIFKAIGANPVPMAFGEVYTALQNGTVDGACNSITALVAPRFYEVAPHFAVLDMCFSPTPLIFSREKLDSMPQEYQALIRKAGEEAAVMQWKETVDQEKAAIELMKAAGCTIEPVTNKQEWIDLIVPPVYASVENIVPASDIEAVQNTK